MKLKILVDNNTLIDRYFLAEPGFSVFIEEEKCRLLLDTGYSDIFIRNSQKMGVDLSHLDYLVLSHNHLDHTWGLEPLIRFYSELHIEGMTHHKPSVVCHSQTFTSVIGDEFSEFGPLISQKKLEKHFRLHLSDGPLWLTDRLVFLGQIPRLNDFESSLFFGRKEGSTEKDKVLDDSALAYLSEDGLVIITGCSHAGICNIIHYAQEITGEKGINDIIGGLHLQDPPEGQLQGTLDFFKTLNLQRIHPCHCTDLSSKIALSRVTEVREVGVGLSLEY